MLYQARKGQAVILRNLKEKLRKRQIAAKGFATKSNNKFQRSSDKHDEVMRKLKAELDGFNCRRIQLL